ncbi:MAG: phenylacetic acid degradation-related protein [Firmicutes bacterium]|nr:phenylacetic acid degradation-related protein [Bacillota bacterium]
MGNYIKALLDNMEKIYERSPLLRLLGITVTDLKEGEATGKMPISAEVHTNVYTMAHGGAIASLADTVMGAACTTSGKSSVTLDFSMNYIRAVPAEDTITAHAKVIHNGKSTMVVDCQLSNGQGQLIATARATFFVTGEVRGILE